MKKFLVEYLVYKDDSLYDSGSAEVYDLTPARAEVSLSSSLSKGLFGEGFVVMCSCNN